METNARQTDSTREQTHELHIQVRVAEELQRLQAHEAQVLKELEDRISAEMTSTDDGVGGQADAAKVAGDRFRDLGRESIQREISDLRQKLQSRKKLEDLDEGVDRAKSEVVQCLRKNNTRPLDCWKEVETFRREVGRLEKAFLDKTLT